MNRYNMYLQQQRSFDMSIATMVVVMVIMAGIIITSMNMMMKKNMTSIMMLIVPGTMLMMMIGSALLRPNCRNELRLNSLQLVNRSAV